MLICLQWLVYRRNPENGRRQTPSLRCSWSQERAWKEQSMAWMIYVLCNRIYDYFARKNHNHTPRHQKSHHPTPFQGTCRANIIRNLKAVKVENRQAKNSWQPWKGIAHPDTQLPSPGTEVQQTVPKRETQEQTVWACHKNFCLTPVGPLHWSHHSGRLESFTFSASRLLS